MFGAAISKMAAAQPVVARDVPVTPGRLVHIDGDALAYKASGPEGTDAGTSRIIALNLINKAKARTGSERAIVHMTADGADKAKRYLIATVKPYQAKRAGSRKPDNWAYLREFLCNYGGEEFTRKVWSQREADDGIAACAAYAVKCGRLDAIHADDKDMRMLPGLHLSWREDGCITEVDAEDYCAIGKDGKVYGQKWFWLQMLHGDAADNIPGLEQTWVATVPGAEPRMARVGEKLAEKLLAQTCDATEAMDVVLKHYERGYFGQGADFAHDRFMEQAALLWLRRDNMATIKDVYNGLPAKVPALYQALLRLEARVEQAVAALKEIQA
jgi:hypothetical protein